MFPLSAPHPACPGARTPWAPGPRPYTAPTMSARPWGLPSDGGPWGRPSPTPFQQPSFLQPAIYAIAFLDLCSRTFPKTRINAVDRITLQLLLLYYYFIHPVSTFQFQMLQNRQIRGNMLDQVCVLIQRFNLKTTITKYKNSASICRNLTLGNRTIFFRAETYWPPNF